jgi:hypothetical protein
MAQTWANLGNRNNLTEGQQVQHKIYHTCNT